MKKNKPSTVYLWKIMKHIKLHMKDPHSKSNKEGIFEGIMAENHKFSKFVHLKCTKNVQAR